MKHILVTWFCLVALCLSMIVPEDWQRLAFGVSLACMGPLAVGCDLLTSKPKNHWQHHAAVVLRAVSFLVVGAVLHWNPSPTRSPLFFWLIALATQILIVALMLDAPTLEHDPWQSGMVYLYPAAMFMTCVLIASWSRLALSSAQYPTQDQSMFVSLWFFSSSSHLSLEMSFWLAIFYSAWKSMLWYIQGATPLSQGQHRSYWPRLTPRVSPARFWVLVRDYLHDRDRYCSDAMFDSMVGHLSLDVLYAYFVEFEFSRSHRERVLETYARLTQAVQKRIAELDPRTVPVFALYENDWPTLVHMFKHLDDAPSETYALPL